MSVSSRTRRRLALGLAAVAVTAAIVGWMVARTDTPGEASVADTDQTTESRRTATVERRDLIRTIDAVGSLGYGEQAAISATAEGTITTLPEPGTVIDFDEPLYWVDDEPGPILLEGDLPMWRELRSGVDDGADVAQLEANLVDLDFADDDLTIDEDFTWLTARAIRDWQEAHDLEETGRVEPGDVWFSPSPVRVAVTVADVGDSPEGEILTVTGTERLVRVDLEARYGQYAKEGDTVGLELVDGTTTTGTITAVADVATVTEDPSGSVATTIAVEITADTELDVLDESPVTVSFVSDEIADVLAVPLEAVVATADGGYAVEVVDDTGSAQLVEVEVGRFADGWVQVTGDVAEGQTVVTA